MICNGQLLHGRLEVNYFVTIIIAVMVHSTSHTGHKSSTFLNIYNRHNVDTLHKCVRSSAFVPYIYIVDIITCDLWLRCLVLEAKLFSSAAIPHRVVGEVDRGRALVSTLIPIASWSTVSPLAQLSIYIYIYIYIYIRGT